jgi:hypothetical protein
MKRRDLIKATAVSTLAANVFVRFELSLSEKLIPRFVGNVRS